MQIIKKLPKRGIGNGKNRKNTFGEKIESFQ
jgi:hypothetical protein